LFGFSRASLILAAMMIAAAAVQPVARQMTIGWFDGVVVIVLAFGIYRGRRNGMSKEFLPLLQWLILVTLCTFLYPTVGQLFMNLFQWSKLTAYVWGYLAPAFVVLLIFGFLKKKYMEKMGQSSAFGGSEFYLGMLSGLVRAVCILIVVLALLNAPVYTQAEIDAHAAYIKQNLGGGMYSGDYVPDLQEVQEQILKDSTSGSFVKNNLGFLLINSGSSSAPEKPQPKISIGQ
jgi:uncharacterized membrane protein required for colicin V production